MREGKVRIAAFIIRKGINFNLVSNIQNIGNMIKKISIELYDI